MAKSTLHRVGLSSVLFFCWMSVSMAGNFQVANMDELNKLMLRLRATQFLQHATFGPKDAEIDALANRMGQIGAFPAINEWIDQQFAMAPTLHEPTIFAMGAAENVSLIDGSIYPIPFRYQAWWHNAITAPDQLRQRMGWALMQIFVVSETDFSDNQANDKTGQPSWMGLTHYYDMLLKNSFGNYRTLLTDVTFHPAMGVYLSSLRNNKPTATTSPDENYAREVMQLFSIGLHELNPDGSHVLDNTGLPVPTYDNETIKAFARLFTGMTYNQSTSLGSGTENYHEPMMMFPANHDTGAKTLLRGVTLPALPTTPNLSQVTADVHAGLDNIAGHSNVGPFICKQLIQRLIRSNPSKGYLARVVSRFNDNGSGVRGDLKAVVKAILLDQEAWDGIAMVRRTGPFRLEVTGQGTERSRLQEPLLQYSHFLRRYAVSGFATGRFHLPSFDGVWGQSPYKSPSVFNFYLPDFQPEQLTNVVPSGNIPNGELVAPEFMILNSVTGNTGPNRLWSDIVNGNATHYMYTKAGVNKNFTMTFNFNNEIALATNPTALVEHLDKTMCCGTMSESFKTAMIAAINLEPAGTTAIQKTRAALLGVLNSPAFTINE